MHRTGSVVLIVGLLFSSAFADDSSAVSQPVWRPSPTGAALRSLAFPGWGQAYNRRPLKALIVGTIEQGFIFGIVREHQLFRDARKFHDDSAASLYKEQRNRLVWILAGWLIYASVDAYVDAHLFDFDVSDQLAAGRQLPGGINLQIGWIAP